MNHTLSLYDFCNNDIRVIEIDGEPWFPAKDVCDVLGLENPSQILIDSCNHANTAHMLKSNLRSTDVSFPNRGMKCVNEAGLYELILASRKPEARAFKHWVTSVVLPAIRKDGSYVAGEELVATGEEDEDELIMRAMEAQARKVERLHAENRSMRKARETYSLQGYCELNRFYLAPRQRSRLTSLASRMAKNEGIVLKKQERVFLLDGFKVPTKVNLYPRDLLDRAAVQIGLLKDSQGAALPA
ncbi:Bro-N domain-containing protein [Thalassovita sp.]|uniref:BRO-N domain-containing protein n=1 Tax=Thalassovita sp. TaxID=1979401 RepID=UPI002AB1FB4A|nr:BRO family protein [Thalassovita sp.]